MTYRKRVEIARKMVAENKSNQEIADALKAPAGTVKSMLRRENITRERKEVDIEEVRRLTREGYSQEAISHALSSSPSAIRRIQRRMNLRPNAPSWKPKQLVVQVPRSELEAAVDTLRRFYVPVYAETTERSPYSAPKPYGPQTLFRVGGRRSVEAREVLEMARRAA